MKTKVKWVFLAAILVALVLSGCNSEPEAKTYTVGVLSGVDSFNSVFDGFKAQMTELGYIEGENIIYDFQKASGDPDAMAQIAENFVTDEVDMIVTITTGAAKAAQKAIEGTDIPVVFTIVAGPDNIGLVESISQPGANITGISQPPPSLYSKRVEFLTQMAPAIENLWIAYDPDYAPAASAVPFVKEASEALGLALTEVHVKNDTEYLAALDELVAVDTPTAHSILIMPDLTNNKVAETVFNTVNPLGIPTAAHTSGQTKLGGLFSYASNNIETGKAAAVQADKVLKGANPGELPVEVSEVFLTINMVTANTLGLELSDATLRTADEIIR